MLKQITSKKIPTGYALKKRLLNLEYKTKIVGNDLSGDYRVIVLSTSKISTLNSSSESSNHSTSLGSSLGSFQARTLHLAGKKGSLSDTSVKSFPKVVRKRIKKTVFNTVEGIKNLKVSSLSKDSKVKDLLGSSKSKLPVTYVYSVSPPAKTLKEQYEDLVLLAPYIPMKSLLITSASTRNSGVVDTKSGFVGCLIANPTRTKVASNEDLEGGLVFYYPSQLKTWLGHLVESNNQADYPGLAELLQTLDLAILNLLNQVNTSLDTLCILSQLPITQAKPIVAKVE